MTNKISRVLAVGCKMLPPWSLAVAVGVKVIVAMAVVAEMTPGIDCATATA